MDLKDIWYTFQDLASKFGGIKELNLSQFNYYLQQANDELLKTKLNMRFNPSSNVEVNDEQIDELLPFRTSVYISSGLNSINLPSDYARFIAASAGGFNSTNIGVKIDYVTLEEYAERKDCSITAPSATYPVVYVFNNAIYIDPIPTSTVWVAYYKRNAGVNLPSLALKKENGVTKYDSVNSIQLLWGEHLYMEIVNIMLKYIGISIGDPNAIQDSLNETRDAS